VRIRHIQNYEKKQPASADILDPTKPNRAHGGPINGTPELSPNLQ